jgi:hypothetical protein
MRPSDIPNCGKRVARLRAYELALRQVHLPKFTPNASFRSYEQLRLIVPEQRGSESYKPVFLLDAQRQ